MIAMVGLESPEPHFDSDNSGPFFDQTKTEGSWEQASVVVLQEVLGNVILGTELCLIKWPVGCLMYDNRNVKLVGNELDFHIENLDLLINFGLGSKGEIIS